MFCIWNWSVRFLYDALFLCALQCLLIKSCPTLLLSHSLQLMGPFPWPVCVGFLVDEVTVEYVSVRVFPFSPVSTVPTVLHVDVLSLFAVDRS